MHLFKQRSVFLVQYLLIIVFIAIAYHNTLDSPFVFDDEINISRNSSLQLTSLDFESVKKVFSFHQPSPTRPVANLTFALNYLVDEYEPFGFHVVNVLIHCLAAILIFRLFLWYLKRGEVDEKNALRLALFAALVWALNPIQTNAVTYIVQRMTSLCTLFFIASLLTYLHARGMIERRGWEEGRQGQVVGFFVLAFVLWCLAMLSKEIAVILPIILLLHELFFYQTFTREKIRQRKFLYSLVLLVLVILLYVILWPKLYSLVTLGYEKRDFTLTERLLTQPRVIVRYISLFFAPLPSRLTLYYNYEISRSLTEPLSTFVSATCILLLVTGAVVLAKRYKLYSFCVLWMLLCLIVESTVIPLELIFEHRFYLPSIGLSLGIVLLVSNIYRRIPQSRAVVTVFWICIICLLTGLTIIRNKDWHSAISIYADAVEKAPGLIRAYNDLGVAYARTGQIYEAERIFNQALQKDSQNASVLANVFILYSNLGRLNAAKDSLDKLKQSVGAGRFKCTDGMNVLFVADKLEKQKNYGDVIYLLENMAKCPGRNGKYYEKLGLSYARTGNHVQAIKNFKKAVAFEPENAYYLFSLARSYLFVNEKQKALEVYNRIQAVQIPTDLQQHLEQMRQYMKL